MVTLDASRGVDNPSHKIPTAPTIPEWRGKKRELGRVDFTPKLA